MIYFIQRGTSGFIKIGYTRDKKSIEKRIEALQVGSHEPLYCLGLIRGTCKDEKLFHKKFHMYRAHGEWFRPLQPLLDFIELVCDKSQDIYNQPYLNDLKIKTLEQIIIETKINHATSRDIISALKYVNAEKTKVINILSEINTSLQKQNIKLNVRLTYNLQENINNRR